MLFFNLFVDFKKIKVYMNIGCLSKSEPNSQRSEPKLYQNLYE